LIVSYDKQLLIISGIQVWSLIEVACEELRDRLGLEDVVTVLQHSRLRWYSHVFRKDDSERVKKCMDFVVEGDRCRDRPKRTWKEVVEGI